MEELSSKRTSHNSSDDEKITHETVTQVEVFQDDDKFEIVIPTNQAGFSVQHYRGKGC